MRSRLIPSALPVLLAACAALGCSGSDVRPAAAAASTQPKEFVGRWVRLRQDSTWGDTLEYLADGRVLGSTGHPVPPSARWGVRPGATGSPEFCVGDASVESCRTYRLEGEQMVVDGGPNGPSVFRRAP